MYDLLIRAIPPPAFFNDRDPIKQNLTFPMEFGPALSAAVWGYMDDVIARQVVRPAVLDKFIKTYGDEISSLARVSARRPMRRSSTTRWTPPTLAR